MSKKAVEESSYTLKTYTKKPEFFEMLEWKPNRNLALSKLTANEIGSVTAQVDRLCHYNSALVLARSVRMYEISLRYLLLRIRT